MNDSSTLHYALIQRLGSALQRKRTLIQSGVLLVFLGLFGSLALWEPDLDWDMLAYVANASQLVDEKPINELHSSVYENLKNTVPDEAYQQLIGTPSRAVLSEDPEAFRQTIAFFYDTRVVYTGLLAGLITLGVEPFFGSYLISVICAIASILLLARLLPIRFPFAMCLALPCIAMSCGLFTVARISSPDALATLTTIVLYWMLIRNWKLLLLLLMPLCVFIRTDLIVLLALFYAYFLLNNRYPKILVFVSGFATLAMYWVLNHMIVEGDPWTSLIGYKYGEKPTHPEEFSFSISISDYMYYLFLGAKTASYTPMLFIFGAISVAGISLFSSRFFYNSTGKPVTQQHADVLFLLVSNVIYVVLHFLLFPVLWVRFFAAQYSLAAVVLIWMTLYLMAARNYSNREDVDLI